MAQVSGAAPGALKLFSSEKSSKNRAVIRRKLERIRRKLRGGGRLTASEKEFLRRYAPELYEEAMALEREREAYERRLKQCKTKEEAERVKTEKMREIAATQDKDPDTILIRMAQTKAAEDAATPMLRRKPSQLDKEKKQAAEARRKRRKEEEEEREKLNRERRERERQEEKYYEEKRIKEKEDQRYWAREAGIIYKRPVREMDGDTEGEVIKAANLERVDRQAEYVRGRAAYQAAASLSEESRENASGNVNGGSQVSATHEDGLEQAGDTSAGQAQQGVWEEEEEVS